MKRIRCEVFLRVAGYYRPVNQWNNGKREEFNERKTYVIKDEQEECDGQE